MIISLILLFFMVLSVSASFAADDDVAMGVADNEITVEEDVLSVEEDTDTLNIDEEQTVTEVTDNSEEVVGTSNVVTNDTFYNYFDETGNLLDTVTDEELVFEGDFSKIGVTAISVDRSIKFTGNNAVFNGAIFTISSSNVEINGFDITGSDYALIMMDSVSNITISNCKINFTSIEETDGFAIWAQNIDNLKLINNAITYVGNTNGAVVNNAVRIESSKNILVENNLFDITMPSAEIPYDSYTYAQSPVSEGIVMLSSENITFNSNNVTMDYNEYIGSYDTIHVLVFGNGNFDYDEDLEIIYPNVCKNVLINNNKINAKGHEYNYGIFIACDNFEIKENTLNMSADSHYAAAFDIENPSSNGVVSNNYATSKAPDLAYGVYSYGTIDNVTYSENTLIADAYGACGMEIVNFNPTISKNTITLTGNYTTGIVANINEKGTISENVISSLGSNMGTVETGDGMVHKESVGIGVNGDNVVISNNQIISTSMGINLKKYTGAGNIDVNANTINVEANSNETANYAIYADAMETLNITNNKITFKGKSNGTTDSNAISVTGIDDVIISNNNIDATLTAGQGSAIKLSNCPDLTLSGNTVSFDYDGHINWGLYIDAGCDNAKVSDNNINALGSDYVYGIYVLAQNFTVEENTLNIASDVNYACGVNPDGGASGVVNKNDITVNSVGCSYGIYSGMWSSDYPLTVNYTNNVIKGNSFFACGIEVGGAKENIVSNDITVDGNYTIGIGLYKYAQNTINTTIENNTIASNGKNIGDANSYWDSLGIETTGIKIKSGNVTISGNTVQTTGDYAMNLDNSNATVTDNDLIAKKSSGDMSIANKGNAIVSGSSPEFKTILVASDLTKTEGAADQFVVTAIDENGNVISNIIISISINGAVQNATTDEKGVAKFNIDLTAGTYVVQSSFAGDKVYGQKSIENKITVNAKPVTPTPAPKKVATKITAKKKTFKAKVKVKKYTITLKAGKNPVKKVKVTLKVKGKTYKATTNAKGKATFKIKNLKKKGKYTATIKFAGKGNYLKSSKKVKITVKK